METGNVSHRPQTPSKKTCALIERPLYNEKGIPEAAEEHEAKPVCRFVLVLLAAARPEAQAGLGLRKRGRDARLAAPSKMLTVCSRWPEDEGSVQTFQIARPIDLSTFVNPTLNAHLMSARRVKKAVIQNPCVLLKHGSLFRLGKAMNCNVI